MAALATLNRLVLIINNQDFVVGANRVTLGPQAQLNHVGGTGVVHQALSHAEHLLNRAAEHRLDLARNRRCQLRAAHLQGLQGRQGHAALLRGGDPRLSQRRHQRGGGHTLHLNEVERSLRGRIRCKHQLAGGAHDAQNTGRAHREVVRGGQHYEHGRVVVQLADIDRAAHRVQVGGVGARNQLRNAGGTAGELQERHLLARAGLLGVLDDAGHELFSELFFGQRGQRLRNVNSNRRLQGVLAQLGGNVLVQGGEICAGGQRREHVRRSVGAGRKVHELGGAVLRQAEHRQRSRPENTQQVHQVLGGVTQLQQHTVARLHASLNEARRSGTTCRLQLTVGEANLLGLAVLIELRVRERHQRREVRLRAACIQQELGDSLVDPVAGFSVLRGKRLGDERRGGQGATFYGHLLSISVSFAVSIALTCCVRSQRDAISSMRAGAQPAPGTLRHPSRRGSVALLLGCTSLGYGRGGVYPNGTPARPPCGVCSTRAGFIGDLSLLLS